MSETTNEPNVIPAASCVLISGGSRGLGLAFVEEVLANGAKVAAFARTVTPELQQLMDANPERVYVGSVDITDSKAVTSFIKDAAKVLGPIDALVNNAAIGQDSLHLHTTPERIEDIISTNLTATLLVTRAFMRHAMAKVGKGRIVNVTSVCAQRGYAGLVAYSATKGGLDAATRSLAVTSTYGRPGGRARQGRTRCPTSPVHPRMLPSSRWPRPWRP